MALVQLVSFAVCVVVLRAQVVIPLTDNSTHSFLGVYLILAIDIIIGLVSMEGWIGMVSSVPPLLTLSQWGSRY